MRVSEELTDLHKPLPHTNWHHLRADRRRSEYISYTIPSGGISIIQESPERMAYRCGRMDC